MTFKIISGEYSGKAFDCHYNIEVDSNGRISAGFGSDFARDIGRIDEAVLSRLDRISLDVFKNKSLRARIKGAKTDHRKDNIPAPIRYSKIEPILGVVPQGVTVVIQDFDDDCSG